MISFLSLSNWVKTILSIQVTQGENVLITQGHNPQILQKKKKSGGESGSSGCVMAQNYRYNQENTA
jgi:hypothetical protein